MVAYTWLITYTIEIHRAHKKLKHVNNTSKPSNKWSKSAFTLIYLKNKKIVSASNTNVLLIHKLQKLKNCNIRHIYLLWMMIVMTDSLPDSQSESCTSRSCVCESSVGMRMTADCKWQDTAKSKSALFELTH